MGEGLDLVSGLGGYSGAAGAGAGAGAAGGGGGIMGGFAKAMKGAALGMAPEEFRQGYGFAGHVLGGHQSQRAHEVKQRLQAKHGDLLTGDETAHAEAGQMQKPGGGY